MISVEYVDNAWFAHIRHIRQIPDADKVVNSRRCQDTFISNRKKVKGFGSCFIYLTQNGFANLKYVLMQLINQILLFLRHHFS